MINNQKDTQKTGSNTYGHSDVSNVNALSNIPLSASFDIAVKKTEKLVTALYLVSDCMDTDDALKAKIRLLGVELLSDIHELSALSPLEKHAYISILLSSIHELISFIDISHNIGFISEMNTSILKKEFSLLAADLIARQEKDKHFTFTLDNKMFDLSDELQQNNLYGNENDLNYSGQKAGQRGEHFENTKRTPFGSVSHTNNKALLQNSQIKKSTSTVTTVSERKDRTEKILELIKNKKDISIKDISLAFTDCSEKTIQRELNSLIAKGHLKKSGTKRWSRYSIEKI